MKMYGKNRLLFSYFIIPPWEFRSNNMRKHFAKHKHYVNIRSSLLYKVQASSYMPIAVTWNSFGEHFDGAEEEKESNSSSC